MFYFSFIPVNICMPLFSKNIDKQLLADFVMKVDMWKSFSVRIMSLFCYSSC